jgi:hypothetical protein
MELFKESMLKNMNGKSKWWNYTQGVLRIDSTP